MHASPGSADASISSRKSLRVRAAFDWDDDPAASLPVIDEAAEVARVHGLVEGTGWADYGRAEANLSLGDWDAAIATGLEAIAYAEARDLRRIVVRTWFALRPIAVARGRVDLLEQAYPPFAARQGVEPDSFYARIVTTAMHLAFADAGLEPRFVPDSRRACRASTWTTAVRAGSPPSRRSSTFGSRRASSTASTRALGACGRHSLAPSLGRQAWRCRRRRSCARVCSRAKALVDQRRRRGAGGMRGPRAVVAREGEPAASASWRATKTRLREAERIEAALGMAPVRPPS